MTLEALDWNVVVAGYWNPAILTPSGIARRLFGLPEGTPIQVEVPMDGLGLAPHRVRHDGLIVTAVIGRLEIVAETASYDRLDRAREIAARAIEALPQTPLTAAGYNVKVKVGNPANELLSAMKCEIDALLSDAPFSIESQSLQRSLKVENGVLNLGVQKESDDVTVDFNFHRQSSKQEELVSWLKYPIKKVEETVSLVLEKVIRVSAKGIGK